ncbi:MAG: prepilin-type N-terminal cleavage/methylation domain-containing protein [Candidatus Sungbacteria bacterium]|nr:prepilin-type N-terminal cleavage/methylation domain-containing protein [Candidatus Sungbacteria bacterium]
MITFLHITPKQQKNTRRKFSEGFTIMELIVVIAIISILSSMIIVQFRTARERARDAEREAEIKSLQTALALHIISSRLYPSYTDVVIDGTDQLTQDLRTSNALQGVARDPIHSGNYRYIYNPTDGGTYTYTGNAYRIRYYLETDSIVGKPAGQHNATP